MLINDRESFEYARTVLIDADVIALDTETWWGERWDQRLLMGISTHCKIKGREPLEISFYFPFRHQHNLQLFNGTDNLPIEWLRELAVPLERRDATFIFHNAKYDLQVLRRENIHIHGSFYDTMLMSFMVNENTSHALKTLGKIIVSEDAADEQKALKNLMKHVGGWNCIPPEAMELYASKDAELTYRLWEHFMPLMEKEELSQLWRDEMDFCLCLTEMERRGIGLDRKLAEQFAAEAETRMQAIQKTLGFDPAKPSQLAHKLYQREPDGLGLMPSHSSKNRLASPITLSDGRTLEYVPIMDESTLTRYDHPVISLVLEYREKQKDLSTYFRAWLNACCDDGRIHPSFKQHGTKTTRLSCAEPNFQQIPREDHRGVKKMVKATDGFEVWEFDYSQIEFRLAACYAKEEILIEGYKAGNDFHSLTAQQLSVSRHQAKTINFAILYGAGPRKLAEQLGISEAEGRAVLASFRQAYPRLHDTAVQAERAAHRGYVKYWTGRKRHFEYPSEYHKAFNSVVQGGAAEIVKHTMLRFYREHPEVRLICQVHDALWFEVPNGDEETLELIQKVMEWPTSEFPIPFPVEKKRLA